MRQSLSRCHAESCICVVNRLPPMRRFCPLLCTLRRTMHAAMRSSARVLAPSHTSSYRVVHAQAWHGLRRTGAGSGFTPLRPLASHGQDAAFATAASTVRRWSVELSASPVRNPIYMMSAHLPSACLTCIKMCQSRRSWTLLSAMSPQSTVSHQRSCASSRSQPRTLRRPQRKLAL